ncbi:MAG: type II toxin-antitoxin system VapC family toxin [Deltaproteobacteria bacterium]|nr:type II toxin-antitoxin system VapC family toxin [Deltaproteobacteria bacterium]
MKLSLYVETSVPSYYVSRDSRDVVVLAHQQITRAWWETRLPDFRAFVSPVVLEEARAGDPEQARKRLEVLAGFEILEAGENVERLAARYMAEFKLPGGAIRDAAHLAFACVHEMDFLVTWNCAHIANAEVVRRLAKINAEAGISTPTICTPEELLGMAQEE